MNEGLEMSSSTRELLRIARQLAESFRSAQVGTEHILLAALRSDQSALARALTRRGVDIERLRERIEPALSGPEQLVDSPQYTPRLTKALADAVGEAGAYGSSQIEPIHLLLAIASQEDGAANRLLFLESRLDPPAFREAVLDTLPSRDTQVITSGSPRPDWERPEIRWEYRLEGIEHIDTDSLGWLNDYGALGWEFVALVPDQDHFQVLLKRRLP
jgi:ATP-dependent Clp protease ATP-binding subunit ClpA